MPIEEFLVTDPQTSHDVRLRVAKLIEERGDSLPLTVMAVREIPRPEAITFIMQVLGTMGNLEDHGMTVTGNSEEYPSVKLYVHEEPEEPATASIVTP